MLIGRTIVVGVVTLVLAAAHSNAAPFPLYALNAGPSSDSVPTAAGDRVATVVYPREIANPAIIPMFGDIYPLNDATQVEAAGATGIRWRSAALFPANSNTNSFGEMAVVALTDGFDASAGNSFILFLNQDMAAGITDLQALADFIANASPGDDFVRYVLNNPDLDGGTGFQGAQLTEALLDDQGIVFTQADLDAATPDGGGAQGQYADFNMAIVVFSDGVFTGANAAVATEWISVDNDGQLVAPSNASFDFDNQTIRIHTNQQLVDDFDSENPADTDVGNISASNFRVLLSNGTNTQTLANFLSGLNDHNTVASIDILTADNQNHKIIEIELTNEITDDADIATIFATRIGFLGADIDSVTGDNQTNATSTYQLMDRPEDVPYPVIILEPQSQLVDFGGPVSFSVSAIGDPPLTYQWRRDGKPLPLTVHFSGADSPLLTFDANVNDIGLYDCVVTNGLDDATSQGAILAVRPSCAGDANGDGAVNFADLNEVVARFNTACP